MAWIESHQSLRDHPKLLAFEELLRLDHPCGIAYLQCLWWWCIDYADDGDISPFSPPVIARGSLWMGDPQAFIDALVESGFVDRDGKKLTIHNWDIYSGKLISSRRQIRDGKRAGGIARALTASRNQQGRYTQPAASQQPASSPSSLKPAETSIQVPTQQVPTQQVPVPPVCPPPVRTKGSPAAAVAKKIPKTLPRTNLKQGKDLLALFSEDEVSEAYKLFPAFNFAWEAGKCVAWHNDHGGSANWKLAFKNWLDRAKATGPPRRNGRSDAKETNEELDKWLTNRQISKT